ncbi:MAG: TldD/PmbA family protein [Acidimicrobiia bacterium]
MSRYMDLCEQVLELVGRRAEAQVMVAGGRSALTRFANSFIHQNVGEDQLSVNLKVVVDGRVASASTTRSTVDALQRLVEGAIDAAKLRPVDPDWPGLAPPAEVQPVEHYDEATAEASPEERAAVVKEFVAAGDGMRAAGYCDTEGGLVAFASTAGQRAEGRSTRATVDGIHQTESSAGAAHQTALRLADLDGSAGGQVAARKARDASKPVELEPGRYEVVLEPECVATIVVFLSFYGLNGKAVAEGQSFARVGERQFDRTFNIWDSVAELRALGVPFDAEGTPKRKVDFVREGVVESLAHDRRTAGKLDAESTGHAIPGGEVWGAFPSNVFVGTGNRSLPEMIGAVERGLLVTQFNYCRILDPKTQVVTGLTRNGTFLIEGGEVTKAVGNLRFTQSFVKALGEGSLLGIGSESRFADSEFGAGFIVAPAVHLAEWNFTGGAKG